MATAAHVAAATVNRREPQRRLEAPSASPPAKAARVWTQAAGCVQSPAPEFFVAPESERWTSSRARPARPGVARSLDRVGRRSAHGFVPRRPGWLSAWWRRARQQLQFLSSPPALRSYGPHTPDARRAPELSSSCQHAKWEGCLRRPRWLPSRAEAAAGSAARRRAPPAAHPTGEPVGGHGHEPPPPRRFGRYPTRGAVRRSG